MSSLRGRILYWPCRAAMWSPNSHIVDGQCLSLSSCLCSIRLSVHKTKLRSHISLFCSVQLLCVLWNCPEEGGWVKEDPQAQETQSMSAPASGRVLEVNDSDLQRDVVRTSGAHGICWPHDYRDTASTCSANGPALGRRGAVRLGPPNQ